MNKVSHFLLPVRQTVFGETYVYLGGGSSPSSGGGSGGMTKTVCSLFWDSSISNSLVSSEESPSTCGEQQTA